MVRYLVSVMVVLALCAGAAQGQYSLLREFAGGVDDGNTPMGSLTLSGSTLYGMTYSGGDRNQGTVFGLVVPEPSSLPLVVAGGLALIRRRRS